MLQTNTEGEESNNQFDYTAKQQLYNCKCIKPKWGLAQQINSINKNIHHYQKSINQNIWESSAPILSIIKPHEKQRIHQELLNCLTALQDNQIALPSAKYAFKSFLSTSKVLPADYDKFQILCKLLEPRWIELYNEFEYANYYVLKQIFDIIKMQYDQITTNALLFESPMLPSQYNNAFAMLAFFVKYEQSKLSIGKIYKQKILFINLSGNTRKDFEIYNHFFGLSGQCLYIALEECDTNLENLTQRTGYFKTIQLNTNSKLNWKQFKIIFKAEIKRDIELFKPTLCILSIGKSFENQRQSHENQGQSQQTQEYLSFDNYSLQRIVKLIKQVSNDKLIIHAQIQKQQQQQQASPTEMQQEQQSNTQISQEQNQLPELFQFINAIQQGILNLEGKSQRLFELDDQNYTEWLLSFIEKFQSKIPKQALQIYIRELQNRKTVQKPLIKLHAKQQGIPILLHKPYDDFKKFQPSIIQINYNGKNVYVSDDTLLNIDYEVKILALFDIIDCFLYFGKFNEKTYTDGSIECNCIDLSQILQDQQNLKGLSMTIKKSLIILLPLQNQEILVVNYETQQILSPAQFQYPAEQKKSLKNKVIYVQQDIKKKTEFRSRPGIAKNSIDSQFDLMVIGGELINSHKVCNIIELLKIDNSTGNCSCASIILQKELIFEKNNFKPYPHMLILENSYQPQIYVFLPGDYNDKKDKYKQVINSEHSTYAMVLSCPIDTSKFSWEKYEIYYEKSEQGEQPAPITEYTHQQNNIRCLGGLKWNIAMSRIEPKRFGVKSNSQGIYLPDESRFCQYNDLEGNFCVVTRLIELELTSRTDAGKTIKSLIIRQKSFQIGSTMDLIKQFWGKQTQDQIT